MEKNAAAADVSLQNIALKTPVLENAVRELEDYWKGSRKIFLRMEEGAGGNGGFRITAGSGEVSIASASDCGLLYGAYALLRMQQTGCDFAEGLMVEEEPSYDLRILDHWDNLDGTVERGYAGRSIWKWDELPERVSPLYAEYARANASIGINGVVLNNVNANPAMLSAEMLKKAAVVANVLRQYGIRVFLSVNFASPVVIGHLDTADPAEESVKKWWEEKADEIYRLIPDFGGFLVKANSEGQPGPQDYGRTHAEGANMLAQALAKHEGVVLWRAFVYSAAAAAEKDRACLAYEEFMPLDGAFLPNVIIQIKNGPIDFQPHEPFTPLFGGMQHTQIMLELQITQEYLGQSLHTVFLPTMWKDCLDAETFDEAGETVAGSTLRRVTPQSKTAIAGVANVGDTLNWTGNDLAQANWYAFGRLSWNVSLSAARIAEEFLCQTYTCDEKFVTPVRQLLLRSWNAAVNYMTPLGLHHICAYGHHYGPQPWCDLPVRRDWLPSYYHNADTLGLGFDRTTGGSGYVLQYHEPLASAYNNIQTCPEEFLLWFHHVEWDYALSNGLSLWDNLCYAYQNGAEEAEEFVEIWEKARPYVDDARFEAQLARFRRQARDAEWWRDACLSYFQTFSRRPFPPELPPQKFSIEESMNYKLNIDNCTAAPADKLP